MDIKSEFEGANLGDKRLNKRLEILAETFKKNHGGSILFSCGNWSSTKAAYRFFDNERFDEEALLEPHVTQTLNRMGALEKNDPVLMMHDSSEVIFAPHREIQGSGFMGTYKHNMTGKEMLIKGLMLHSSLAVTTTGIPLGLTAQKSWTRDVKNRRKIRNAGKCFGRIPIEEKESFKWIEGVNASISNFEPERVVHICDRDADVYELFFNCMSLGTNFVIRAVHQRLTSRDGVKIFDRISRESSVGEYTLQLPKTHKRSARTARIKVRFYKVRVLPSIDKKKDFPPIDLFVVSAKEHGKSSKDKVDWKILTNLPIKNFEQALEKINWYKMRWDIEIFFKVLKSGLNIERSRLQDVNRIKKFISFVSVLAWHIFWMTKLSRESPEASADQCFTKDQKKLLIKIEKESRRSELKKSSPLVDFVTSLARLGGYLGRKSDPPPGPIVLWRAMQRFCDIQLGAGA